MIFKKPVLSDGITESTFECKRDGLTIRGTIYRPKGDHLPIAMVFLILFIQVIASAVY